MLVKFVLYNSEHALNRDILSTFFAVFSLKTDVSTAPLFNIVKVLSYKTDDSTVLLFYTAKALSGSRFEDRRPCYCTFSATAILHCEGSLCGTRF